MLFNSIKEINRLLSMSNIYLKVTIEENKWHPQDFDFLGLKNLLPGQIWGAAIHENIIEF